jgi:hypothetical protein
VSVVVHRRAYTHISHLPYASLTSSKVLDCIADVLWCSVCACIQVQHKVSRAARVAIGVQGRRRRPGGTCCTDVLAPQ